MKNLLTILLVLVTTVMFSQSVKSVILKNDRFITEVYSNGDTDIPLIIGVTPMYENDNGTSNRTYFSQDYSYEFTFIMVDGIRKVVKIVKMFENTIVYSWTINKPASKSIKL